MAYSPSEKYPGAVDVDPDYQGGKFRDNNPSTTNNGSPLKAIDRNELLARDEAIMNDAGFEYSGVADTPQDSQLFKAYKASLGNGANLLSNHNFLIQTPDDSQPLPSATPTSYPPGHQIFSGVFANETTGITNLTYINGRVSFSGGDLYFAVPNTGGIARLTSDQLVASVADFDGKPRTRGVSFTLVGDEYRVTVGIDALEDAGAGLTPLGSVKFEQGSVATGNFVGANAKELAHAGDSKTFGGVGVFPVDSTLDVQVGETLPSGTQIISYNGKRYKTSTGAVSGEIEVITDNPALLKIVGIVDPIPLVLIDNGDPSTNILLWGASDLDDGTVNDQAFYACLAEKGKVQIPDGVTLRTKAGWHTTADHQEVTFGGAARLEPGDNNIEVFGLKYDYGTVYNLRVFNSGSFTGCTGLAFTPRAANERVNQRYNRSIFQYIENVEFAIRLQCGDFVSIAEEVSGCWYNRVVGGGELRGCSYGIYLEKGLKSQPTYEDPAPNNRNTFSDVSMHFITVRGVFIEAGDTNAFNQVQVESCNTAGFIAFEILFTSPEPQQGNNDRNAFVNCGCESVAQSVNILNRLTNFTNWMGERNTGDFWGKITSVDGREPDRAPYITPTSYVQNFGFDPALALGREYKTLARGIEYSSGSKETPTPVGTEFEVYDKDFPWQTFDLSAAINNAPFTLGIGKFQKSANWIDIAVRARVGSVTGDLTITLPYQADSDMYVASASGAGFKHPIIVAPGGSPELGYIIFVTSTLVRITAPSGGWTTSNDFNFEFRYKAG